MIRHTDPFLPKNTQESPYHSNFGKNVSNFLEGEAQWRDNLAYTRPGNSLGFKNPIYARRDYVPVDSESVKDKSNSPMFSSLIDSVPKVFAEGFSTLTGQRQEPIPNAKDLIQAPPEVVGHHPNMSDRKLDFTMMNEIRPDKGVVALDIESLQSDTDVYGHQYYTEKDLNREKSLWETNDHWGGYTPWEQVMVPEMDEGALRIREKRMDEKRLPWDLKVIKDFRLGPKDTETDSRQTSFDDVPNYNVNNRKNVYSKDIYNKELEGFKYLDYLYSQGKDSRQTINKISTADYTHFGNPNHLYKGLEHGKNILDPVTENRKQVFHLGNSGNLVGGISSVKDRKNIKLRKVDETFYLSNTEGIKTRGNKNSKTMGMVNKVISSRGNVSFNNNNGFYVYKNDYTNKSNNKTYKTRDFMGRKELNNVPRIKQEYPSNRSFTIDNSRLEQLNEF